MAKAFDVQISCRVGTIQLDTQGSKDQYHTVTICREYSEIEAMEHVQRQLQNKREVRNAWYVPVEVE